MNAASDLTLSEAANRMPRRNGKAVHINTLRRWVASGCRGVKLNAWRIGGVWYTSESAIEQFKRECTKAVGGSLVPTPADIAAEVARARENLRKRGFYGQRKQRNK